MNGEQKMYATIAWAAAVVFIALIIMMNWPMSDAEAQYRQEVARTKAEVASAMAENGYNAEEIAVVVTCTDLPSDRIKSISWPTNTEND